MGMLSRRYKQRNAVAKPSDPNESRTISPAVEYEPKLNTTEEKAYSTSKTQYSKRTTKR